MGGRTTRGDVARPSLCFPPTGTKAGFLCGAWAMEAAVSLLLWFASVCFRLCAARGGRQGMASCPGGRLVGQTGRPGAPLPLGGGRYRPAGVLVAACGGYGGSGGGIDQGASGAQTRRCAWRGSRPWMSRHRGVRRWRPFLGEGGGQGACHPALQRGCRDGPPRRCWALQSMLRGGGGGHRWAAAFRRSAADRGGGGGSGSCHGSAVASLPFSTPYWSSAVPLVRQLQKLGAGVAGAMLEGQGLVGPGG